MLFFFFGFGVTGWAMGVVNGGRFGVLGLLDRSPFTSWTLRLCIPTRKLLGPSLITTFGVPNLLATWSFNRTVGWRGGISWCITISGVLERESVTRGVHGRFANMGYMHMMRRTKGGIMRLHGLVKIDTDILNVKLW